MSGVRVLVGTRKGAFVLTSDGTRRRWDVSGPHFAGWEVYHVKGSPADPDRLYASQTSGWFGQIIQRSDDGGRTWHQPGTPPGEPTTTPDGMGMGVIGSSMAAGRIGHRTTTKIPIHQRPPCNRLRRREHQFPIARFMPQYSFREPGNFQRMTYPSPVFAKILLHRGTDFCDTVFHKFLAFALFPRPSTQSQPTIPGILPERLESGLSRENGTDFMHVPNCGDRPETNRFCLIRVTFVQVLPLLRLRPQPARCVYFPDGSRTILSLP